MTGLLVKLLTDRRAWLVLGLVALTATFVVLDRQRDHAVALAESRAETIARDAEAKAKLRLDAAMADAARSRAEASLDAYARTSLEAFQEQAAESARTSARLAEINRRVRAAQEEIARADGSLRLDDPMPDGLRDALACAADPDAGCVSPAPAAPGVLPGGSADAGDASVAGS